MRCLIRRTLPMLLLAVTLLLAACQVPLPYAPVAPSEAEEQADSVSVDDSGGDDVGNKAEAVDEGTSAGIGSGVWACCRSWDSPWR